LSLLSPNLFVQIDYTEREFLGGCVIFLLQPRDEGGKASQLSADEVAALTRDFF
jgi:hypothetical protein